MFDASTAVRALGYPVRSGKPAAKVTGIDEAGRDERVDTRAKRPTNLGWRYAQWCEHHNYEFQTYKNIFGGR